MRYVFIGWVFSLAFFTLAALGARAQETLQAPEPNAVVNGVRVDACASDPSILGLSRIVEIDTAGGPQFGGSHGATGDFLKDGEVILTFDDGPLRTYTRPVLKALAAHCTKATFFMVGRMAASDPAMVKEVAAAGHTVASHTWSHQNLRALGLIKSRQEFETGLSAVTKALGRPPAPFFRFPYLSGNNAIEQHIKSRNVSSIWVDVDSKDYLTRDSKLVHRRIMADLTAKRKGIILMHDIQPSTAGAIRGLLDDLHAKGFKIVHIVPRAAGTAVAGYDRTVDKAFADKAAASAANPPANGSVVLSMSPPAIGTAPSAAPSAAGKAAAATPGTSSTAGPVAVDPAEELPWLKPKVPEIKPVAPKPQPRKARSSSENTPWQPNVFGF